MIFRGRRWLTLGKAAKLLGTSRKSLWLLLKQQEEHGFTVLEKVDAAERVWRYLEEDEVRQTMGEGGVSVPERDTKLIRVDAKTGEVLSE
jgi:biotin operon repressor